MLFSTEEIDNLNFLKETALLLNDLSQKFTEKKFNWKNWTNIVVYIETEKLFSYIKKFIVSAEKFFSYAENNVIDFSEQIKKYNKKLLECFDLDEENRAKEIVNIFYEFVNSSSVGDPYVLYLEKNNLLNQKSFFVEFSSFLTVMTTSNNELKFINTPGYFNKNDYYFEDRRIEKIEDRLSKFEANVAIETQNFLNEYSTRFNEKVDKIIDGLEIYIGDFKTTKVPNLEIDVENLNREIDNTKIKLIGLVGNLDQYESIVSENTENEISKHYAKKAKSEKSTYWGATIVSVFLIIISLILVGWALYDYYINYISISNCVGKADINTCLANLRAVRDATQSFGLTFFIMRFAFSLLLFLTVIYTSRIAIRAYQHWRHSESMHLKLASLRPFINQLEDDERNQIHKDLVPDYFGKDAGMVDSTNEKFKDLPANVSAVAMKAIEQISGGSSNNEGKAKKDNTTE